MVVTYNRRRALGHTLERVLAGDSPVRDCEITVLDNCSTDGTRELLASVAAGHPNLTAVNRRRNIGGNANIVRAFESASRKYIWVLCDDDDFDWSQWPKVEEALASDAYDLVFTVSRIARLADSPDIGYLAFLAGFVPGCIYRTEHITGDVLQNMYAMIHTWYPHCVLSLHIMCNLKGGVFFRPDCDVVIRKLETEDGSREMTQEENDKTLLRGISESLLHPDMRRMFWHVGFVKVAQIVNDEAERAKVIERARFNEDWAGDFGRYCEYVANYNREHFGGSVKNVFDFMLNLPKSKRLVFLMAVLRPWLPLFVELRDGRVELVLFWKAKIRVWDRRWFGGKAKGR
ncbi:MAG: glycosyltransferase [Kiritimatiellae bacterium]|nr:glycosyltransferase [Kiritimatiellia bacterium]